MSQQSRYSDKVQAHKENKQSTGNPGRLQVDHLLLEIGLLRTEMEKMTTVASPGSSPRLSFMIWTLIGRLTAASVPQGT